MSTLVTARGWRVLTAILAAYVDVIAYGFHFGIYNHRIQLPMVAWLNNPALYPGDPVTESFRHFPSVFWNLVALGGRWIEVETLLFVVFLATKVLFFWGLARLVASLTPNRLLTVIICCAVALSPALNHSILEPTETQSSLGVVMTFLAIVFWVEQRWVAAALVLGLAMFVNAIYVAYAVLAAIPLAGMDWKTHRVQILLGGLLFSALSLGFASSFSGVMPRSYPPSFFETLLITYPQLVSIRFFPPSELWLLGTTLVAAGLLTMVLVRLSIERCERLELLTLGFLIPFLIGIVVGEYWPVPQLLRIQFLRSNNLLIACAMIWIQGYGAKLLSQTESTRPAAAILVGAIAVVFPLSETQGLSYLLAVGVILLMEPTRSFDRLVSWVAGRSAGMDAAVLLAVLGILGVAWFVVGGSGVRLTVLAALGAGFAYYALKRTARRSAAWPLAAAASALGVVFAAGEAVPAWSRLWDPIRPPDAMTAAWWDVQKWARASTPIDATFLVPPEPGGFREFSQRPIWTERKDEDIIFTYAEYADTWRSRMASLGITLQVGLYISPPTMIDLYKARSWDELDALARREHLDYIVQFSDVHYAATPEYANEWFAAYRVSP